MIRPLEDNSHLIPNKKTKTEPVNHLAKLDVETLNYILKNFLTFKGLINYERALKDSRIQPSTWKQLKIRAHLNYEWEASKAIDESVREKWECSLNFALSKYKFNEPAPNFFLGKKNYNGYFQLCEKYPVLNDYFKVDTCRLTGLEIDIKKYNQLALEGQEGEHLLYALCLEQQSQGAKSKVIFQIFNSLTSRPDSSGVSHIYTQMHPGTLQEYKNEIAVHAALQGFNNTETLVEYFFNNKINKNELEPIFIKLSYLKVEFHYRIIKKYVATKQFKKAKECLKNFSNLNLNLSINYQVKILEIEAIINYSLNNFIEADENFNKLHQLDPYIDLSASSIHCHAAIKYCLKEFNAAKNLTAQALKMYGDNAPVALIKLVENLEAVETLISTHEVPAIVIK
ncbi:MAG: hypothetical protein LW832_02805 [Parachlamydia sp.]|jgi:tetratricopeptide (TPR) repeat protein|nr:hypothetical protein [Parachlamydia sp.]